MTRKELHAEFHKRRKESGYQAAEAWFKKQRDEYPGGWCKPGPGWTDGKELHSLIGDTTWVGKANGVVLIEE